MKAFTVGGRRPEKIFQRQRVAGEPEIQESVPLFVGRGVQCAHLKKPCCGTCASLAPTVCKVDLAYEEEDSASRRKPPPRWIDPVPVKAAPLTARTKVGAMESYPFTCYGPVGASGLWRSTCVLRAWVTGSVFCAGAGETSFLTERVLRPTGGRYRFACSSGPRAPRRVVPGLADRFHS